MKNFLLLIVILGVILYGGHYFEDEIVHYVTQHLVDNKEIEVPMANEYKKDYNFSFVQSTNNFEPTNMDDLHNIIFTILNSGWNEFTFYCRDSYPTCIEDVRTLAKNKVLLSHINNYVHPFNSYKEMQIKYDSFGTVTISITKTYSDETRQLVENKALEILDEVISEGMVDRDKVKAIHDYIVNNTVYDTERLETGITKYSSDTSYGVLYEGHGFCSGYSNTMALFLELIGLRNYKIASENHVWNYVYLDDQWYHIDVSWDDPVTDNGKQILDHTFFLITTEELKNQDVEEHDYPLNIYIETN